MSSRQFIGPALPGWPDEKWLPPGVIAAPYTLTAIGTGSVAPTSGTVYVVGGPGCFIPAGKTAQSISFLSSSAAVSPTNCWFFLGMPDDGNGGSYVLASSTEAGTTAWPSNSIRTLSLRAEDGGSGEWTATADTPVYIGIVQVAGTPATLRGSTNNGFVSGLLAGRQWWGAGQSGRTTPGTVSAFMSISPAAICASACFVSGV